MAPQRPRPLSPHLTIYRWPVSMVTSITHRATGLALSAGTLLLAWWLVAVSNGPEAFNGYMAAAASPLGLVVAFLFTWALSFHMLNGIRHLAWDLGYGFSKPAAHKSGVFVCALSLIVAAGLFAFALSGHAGYLQ
jgi:succinate dehydrogenase / fumarate reductase cytochrome b subunit